MSTTDERPVCGYRTMDDRPGADSILGRGSAPTGGTYPYMYLPVRQEMFDLFVKAGKGTSPAPAFSSVTIPLRALPAILRRLPVVDC